MNPKLAKFAHKAGVGAAFSLVIGMMVKANARIDDRIDAKYADPEPTPEPEV